MKTLRAICLGLITLISFIINNNTCLFAETRLRVGFINGLSGPWAAYSEAYRRGIELANVAERVTFVYEDDQFAPAKTVTAFNKLMLNDSIDVLLVGDDTTAQAIAPLVAKKRIPLLAWAGSAEIFRNNPFVFRLWDNVETEVDVVKDVIKNHSFKKLQTIVSVHPYASKWGHSICSGIGTLCNSIQEFAVDPQDLALEILRAKNSAIDSFLLCLNPGLNGLFARKMRELHLNFPIIGCNMLESLVDFNAAGAAFDGVEFVSPRVSDDFRKKYLALSGNSSHLVSAAVHYDAALLLARLSHLRGERRVEIIPELMKIKDFSGALGKFEAINEQGDLHMRLQMQMYRVMHGQLE